MINGTVYERPFTLLCACQPTVVGGLTPIHFVTPYTNKQQLILQGAMGGRQPEVLVLGAMFLLNDPAGQPAGAVRIEPVPGPAAMMAMIDAAFSLDPSDRQATIDNFRNVGRVLGQGLGLYGLRYPREHDRLAEVQRAVESSFNE